MVLVMGVSAGAGGARAILTHSDRPELPPIDRCYTLRPPGAGVEEPVVAAIEHLRYAAEQRGELVSFTAVACRTEACAAAVRAHVPNNVQIVNEASAQLRYLNFIERLPEEGPILLYDLGSSGLTLTLADCATRQTLRTRRSTVISGEGFDALLQWRLARLGVVVDGETARGYRETLSADRVVTAEDRKSGARLVFTSNDFADLADAAIQHSVQFVHQLINETGVTPVGMAMTGGCARSWHLVEALQAQLDLAVFSEPEPECLAARGAVLLAVDRPGRVMRVARVAHAFGAAPATLEPTSRRKLVAALAVTGVLGATVAGFLVADRDPDQAQHPTPTDVANIPQRPFNP